MNPFAPVGAVRRALLALCAVAACPSVGWAQAGGNATPPSAFPSRPVRLITPFPAGAGPDAVLRVLADKLQKKWGQTVVVENKPGGNGFIAIDAFKRGATDGHDLIQLDNVHLVAYPHMFKKLPYDPVKDFDTLAPLFRTYFFVGVPAASRYKTVGDILADAKARPGKLNYGSWSVGNPVHLGSALLEAQSGTEMQHIIYKEVSMLYTAVATGELDWSLGSLASAGPMQRTGKIKFIAVTAPKRHAAFPDVPTVAESGGPAGYEVTGWTAVAAPKGLPKALAEKIQKDIQDALAEPDIKERYATFGYEQFPTTPDLFNAFVAAELVKWGKVVQRAQAALD